MILVRLRPVAQGKDEPKALEPKNPDYHERTLAWAQTQTFSGHLGIEVNRIEPGRVEVEMEPTPYHKTAKQYIQPGVIMTIGEYAASMAALTLLAADEHAEGVEVKVDVVRAPRGERLIARAVVEDAGRRLIVAAAEVFVAMGKREALVAKVNCVQAVAPGGD